MQANIQAHFSNSQDAATVFKSIPGKFHILATTASSFPGIGGGVIFANKNWLKSTSHFNMAVDLEVALLQSARNATQNLVRWIQKTYNANFTSLDFSVYNSTEYILSQSDFYSPNMITYTPSLMNASDYFLAGGGFINASGNVNQNLQLFRCTGCTEQGRHHPRAARAIFNFSTSIDCSAFQ